MQRKLPSETTGVSAHTGSHILSLSKHQEYSSGVQDHRWYLEAGGAFLSCTWLKYGAKYNSPQEWSPADTKSLRSIIVAVTKEVGTALAGQEVCGTYLMAHSCPDKTFARSRDPSSKSSFPEYQRLVLSQTVLHKVDQARATEGSKQY